ncbi:DUF805 domain-containing protein [Methanolapillus millepedarum]|uniref:DUF805 domain-containing protein n=1 Tax=Methanolapillus millepedarum TaxID=3028296 RepID=UPI0030B8B540
MIAAIVFCSPAAAFSGAGTGTASDPFQITTISELNEMRDNLSAHYILMNDLDFSGSGFSNWEPIGNIQYDLETYESVREPFSGTLNGNTRTIRNLTVSLPDTPPESWNAGLFKFIGSDGYVFDLTLANIQISGNYATGGALAATNNGTISNCSVINASVYANHSVGGLVGTNYGSMMNCSSSGQVIVIEREGGGLVGRNAGSIQNSFSTASVESVWTGSSKWSWWGNNIGGLCGYNDGGSISNCYATGSVTGDGHVGGLAGDSHGYIVNCYAVGNVTSYQSYAGGLVGLNGGTLKDSVALNGFVNFNENSPQSFDIFFNSEPSTSNPYFNPGNAGSVIGNGYQSGYQGNNVENCSAWGGMTINGKSILYFPYELNIPKKSADDIWDTFPNGVWEGWNTSIWINGDDAGNGEDVVNSNNTGNNGPDFENYQLPVFAQQPTPADASYLTTFTQTDMMIYHLTLLAMVVAVILIIAGIIYFLKRKNIHPVRLFRENSSPEGRLNRRPYIIVMILGIFYLFFLIFILFVYDLLSNILSGIGMDIVSVVSVIIGLALMFASIWIFMFIFFQTARRLHDLNLPGWVALLLILHIIPILAFIPTLMELILFVIDGTKGPNQYGEDPKNRMPEE